MRKMECVLIPDITGWTLLRTMVIPRRYANLATAVCNSLLFVKMTANWFLVSKITAMKKSPMRRDWHTIVMTEYLAALGRPNPSSLDTRTLEKKVRKNLLEMY